MTDAELSLVLCQTSMEWEQPARNCNRLDRLLAGYYEKSGRRAEAEILLLPEFFATGFTLNRDAAEEPGGGIRTWMEETARQYGIAVVGSVAVCENGHLYNRCYFVTPQGEIFHYDKKHLFSLGGESGVFSPGETFPLIRYGGWNIALNTCYDLRFPLWEKNRELAYDLMLVPASWPASRIAVTEHLVKARAIENLAYYAFANRVGEDPGNHYNGHSRVVDYKGNDVAEAVLSREGATVFQALADRNALAAFREKFPVWKDWDICEIKNSFISL